MLSHNSKHCVLRYKCVYVAIKLVVFELALKGQGA